MATTLDPTNGYRPDDLPASAGPPAPPKAAPAAEDPLALAAEAEREYGLPPGSYQKLLKLGEHSVGDGKDPQQTSPKGAVGYAQLMPDTAAEMGVKDIHNVRENIRGGARYLKKQYDAFDHDIDKAYVAYNEGPKGKGIANNPETRAYEERLTGGHGSGIPKPGSETPEEAEAHGYVRAAYKEYEQASKRELADTEAYTDRVKSLDAEMTKIWADRPKPPKMEKNLPEPKELKTNPTQVLGQFLPLLAVFAGSRSKSHAIGAMKAAAAAMDARRKNDQQAFQDAHQTWKDQMEKQRQAFEEEQTEYKEAFEDTKASTDEIVARLHAAAVIHGNAQMEAAIKSGNLDAAYKVWQTAETAHHYSDTVYFESLRAENEAERQRLDRERLDMERGRIPPATKAYNAAYEASRAAGKPEDEARTDAAKALREVEDQLHPTVMAAQGRADRRLVQTDRAYGIYQNVKTYANNINTFSGDFGKGPDQAIILDSFTKLATNQAVRQFMADIPQKYGGLINTADRILASSTSTKGPIMSVTQAHQFYDAAKRIAAEVQDTYDQSMAQHAQTIDHRGGDPADALGQEDLERLIGKGLYKPSERILAQDRALLSGATTTDTAAVPPPPEAIAQLAKSPTPDMKAKFDAVFGQGAADAALATRH